MPTKNQLVRKSRVRLTEKSKAPALRRGRNSLLKKTTETKSPQKRGTFV